MSRMRQTITHTSTTQDHESNLDALLEDLQTTVSRSNSQLNLNGTMTSGYREIRRTVTDGTPHGTMSEYQIEYLNPANSTHHVAENNHSYNGTPNQRHMYKESYNYNTSEHVSGGRSDAKLKQNISELDSLLDDLNTAQKRNFSESTAVTRHTPGIDPGLLEPVTTSTPQGRFVEEKHYREEKVVRGRSTSPRRELVFTGPPRSRDPSPIQPVRQQQFYRYEKTTSTRTTAPVMTDIAQPLDSNQILRSNNLAIEDSSLRGRSPSPGGNRIEYHYSNTVTNNSNNRDGAPHYPVDKVSKYKDHHDAREYSPQRYTTGKTSNSYSYSSTSTSRETRSREEPPRSPPPHRSPSPVSFTQPPMPTGKPKGPYSYDPPPPPQSPTLPQKFSPSDPTNRLAYNVSQPQTVVSSYKYSSTTTNNYSNSYNPPHGYPEEAPLLPRPFPTPSPTPEQDQQPPKKLDELMATFSETEIRNRRNETVHRYDRERERERDRRETESVTQTLLPNGKDRERIVEKEKQIVKKEESKNIQGPPVYYPPGVELFSKKEESMAQQQSGGGMYKAKAKYEYEAKSKSKSKESSGKAVVPVCLPLCCAMPCTIM